MLVNQHKLNIVMSGKFEPRLELQHRIRGRSVQSPIRICPVVRLMSSLNQNLMLTITEKTLRNPCSQDEQRPTIVSQSRLWTKRSMTNEASARLSRQPISQSPKFDGCYRRTRASLAEMRKGRNNVAANEIHLRQLGASAISIRMYV